MSIGKRLRHKAETAEGATKKTVGKALETNVWKRRECRPGQGQHQANRRQAQAGRAEDQAHLQTLTRSHRSIPNPTLCPEIRSLS